MYGCVLPFLRHVSSPRLSPPRFSDCVSVCVICRDVIYLSLRFPFWPCPGSDGILVYFPPGAFRLFALFGFRFFFSRVWCLVPCVQRYRVFLVAYLAYGFSVPVRCFLLFRVRASDFVAYFRALLFAPFARLRLRARLLNVFCLRATVSCACFQRSCCSSLVFLDVVRMCLCALLAYVPVLCVM